MGGLSGTWFVLLGEPGEHLVLESLGRRLSAFWTKREGAEAFLQAHPGLGMEVMALEGWPLKEAFLLALRRLGVEEVLVDYAPGAHQAKMASLEELLQGVQDA
ncbi:MAG: DUF3234 domain-containing protein [Thermus sp.]|uniref:DUF3234 domain-containing protein n=1 Tax=Thermus sp. TaxID=275 RepID=UPI00332FE32B